MKNVSKKSLENVANASSILSPEEQVLLKGGRRKYYINGEEVSEELYKEHYLCVSGNPSQY